MKKLALTIGALLAVASPALAEEPVANTLVPGALVAQAPPMPIAYNWTGLYLGVTGGGDFSRTPGRVTVGTTPITPGLNAAPVLGSLVPLNTSPVGSFTGGGQIGYNYQFPSAWVIGGEVDFMGNTNHQRVTNLANALPVAPPPPFVPGDNFVTSSSWHGSGRVRLGYAGGPALVYLTGGVAFADLTFRSNFIATPSAIAGGVPFPASLSSSSTTMVGWTVGAGAEYAFAPSWSLGGEYRYSDYGSERFNLGTLATVTNGTAFAFAPVSAKVSMTAHMFLAKLNYHFGAPPPPPEMPPAPPPPPQRISFIVFFDWDKDVITREGMEVVQKAAAAYRAGGMVQIQVTGYTDRSGSAGYNQRLSERRANNVAKALAGLGVPPNQMAVSGRGENDNRVPTADGVREPQNRRVEIGWP